MPRSNLVNKTNQLRLYLFGRFQLELDSIPVNLPTQKSKTLIAYLVLNPGMQSREKLASLFWGDSLDTDARNSLRNALALVNKTIGSGLLLADRQTIKLNPEYPLWVDALEFQAQAFNLLGDPMPEEVTINFDLYRNDLLSDLYEDWIIPHREHFRFLFLDSLLRMIQQMRSQSEYGRAIEFANKVLAFDTANERAHQHLMFCYMALGNRNAALQQYERCITTLWEDLAVEPSPATAALADWIKQAADEQKPFAARITNLGLPLTSFIGRKSEMADLKKLLSSTRLITLTGPAGSGKTRLAIQVGTDLLDAYTDGVWWVDLASLMDEALVPQKIAKSLGVEETANQPLLKLIANFLRPKQLVLILDNCEHLVETCGQSITYLLEECSQLSVIATSRETLNIYGEKIWRVPTMSFPDLQSLPPHNQFMEYEAIHLFVDRASAVRSDFLLTEKNAPFVAQICNSLDGIPLAIEIAAAWVRVLSTEQIAARLKDSLKLLSRGNRTMIPRHNTLQASIEWSYDLLSNQERTLFRRLAVFSGGWNLLAAEEICSGESLDKTECLNVITNLIDKSLVNRERGSEVSSRYHFLESIRQYANDTLVQFQEDRELQIRHMNYYVNLVESNSPHLGFFLPDVEMIKGVQILEPEQDNLRKALEFSLKEPSNVELGLRMAGKLHWFWLVLGQFTEGRGWLNQFLAKNDFVSMPIRAQGFLSSGFLACWQGNFAPAQDDLGRSLKLYRDLNDKSGIAFSLHGLGFAANGLGEHAQAKSLFEESLKIAREINDQWLISFALHFLAIGTSFQGDLDRARAMFEESIKVNEKGHGNLQGIAFSLFHLGRIDRLQGNYDLAYARTKAGLAHFWQLGDRRGIGYSLAGLACLAFAQEEMQQAAHLFGVVDAIRNNLGTLMEEILQAEYDHAKAATRQVFNDEEEFQAIYTEGVETTLKQVVQDVLGH